MRENLAARKYLPLQYSLYVHEQIRPRRVSVFLGYNSIVMDFNSDVNEESII